MRSQVSDPRSHYFLLRTDGSEKQSSLFFLMTHDESRLFACLLGAIENTTLGCKTVPNIHKLYRGTNWVNKAKTQQLLKAIVNQN